MVTKDLTGQAMAKQKVLPFGKLSMRASFTRERDDSFSPASRGTEMSVCVGLPRRSPVRRLVCGQLSYSLLDRSLNGNIASNQHPSIAKESSNGKARIL
jgi:hypothetical protein